MALSIAGSDSCGGAGIQRDLATFADIGVPGASAITCVTAQTPGAVLSIHPLPADVVAAQIAAVLRCGNVKAVKTGMLYNAAIIRTVAKYRLKNLVVDPVMVASSGARLLKPAAINALQDRLLPLATVITPNLAEAELLAQIAKR